MENKELRYNGEKKRRGGNEKHNGVHEHTSLQKACPPTHNHTNALVFLGGYY